MDCRTQLATLANEELEKGDFLMATKLLTTYIKMEPNNHDLYFERSICHYKLGNFQASFDDVNNAIRLNPDDYNLYYQKGLVQIGLLVPYEQVLSSFKKAIELRAKQEESKLSDIFKLIKDASQELNFFRRNVGISNDNNQRNGTRTNRTPSQAPARAGSNDPVDSTTDRPCVRAGPSSSHPNSTMADVHHNNNSGDTNISNNLVATNCNTQQSNLNDNRITNGSISTARVSSSAIHHMTSIDTIQGLSNVNPNNIRPELLINPTAQQLEDSKAQFEWNIRRSERIFLHQTSEPSVSGQPFAGVLTGSPGLIVQTKQTKASSNQSSISSARGATRRSHDNMDPNQPIQLPRSKDAASSHQESDVDVDDSCANVSSNELMNPQKRVLITPSSSMPAISQAPPSSAPSRDDSYSSKYKRLRRDRERARRGTSKLCTIKSADLEELQKAPPGSAKSVMRVIAPVDGWLYSGQLSLDNSADSAHPQYVVKLDGDPTGSNYLFSQETVLNDVIKEVRVKSVSDLRKGARICCYWSRQYKCLSTGVVTSRTFEETKSLVSVKYDNNDLSALPLEDLRLLPPDYPKYMSNCDPLLLAKSDGNQVGTVNNSSNNARIMQDKKPPEITMDNIDDAASLKNSEKLAEPIEVKQDSSDDSNEHSTGRLVIAEPDQDAEDDVHKQSEVNHENGLEDMEDDDATIPPTNETIDFITSESTNSLSEDDRILPVDLIERITVTKDTISSTDDNPINNNDSQSSSEENSFGIEYRPWVFEGPLKRNKRHGRTYRDNYSAIRRGDEVIRIGDSAELMPRDESILPFIAKIDGLWATCRGEMRVRVRWYYRLIETEGQPYRLHDGENALFETDHFDENDVQSIYRSTKILSWTDYRKNYLGHINKNEKSTSKVFYLAGYYDPVRRIKHLRSDVEED